MQRSFLAFFLAASLTAAALVFSTDTARADRPRRGYGPVVVIAPARPAYYRYYGGPPPGRYGSPYYGVAVNRIVGYPATYIPYGSRVAGGYAYPTGDTNTYGTYGPAIEDWDLYSNPLLRATLIENQLRWGTSLPPNYPEARTRMRLRPSSPEQQAKSLHAQTQGDVWMKRLRFLNAYERYKVAQSAASDRPEPYFRLGFSLAAVGNFDSAIKYIKQGLDIDPQWPAHGDRLDVLFGEGNRLSVLSLIERVGDWVREDIRDPDRLFLIGVVLHFDGDTRASEFFEAAYRLSGQGDHLLAFLHPANGPGGPPGNPDMNGGNWNGPRQGGPVFNGRGGSEPGFNGPVFNALGIPLGRGWRMAVRLRFPKNRKRVRRRWSRRPTSVQAARLKDSSLRRSRPRAACISRSAATTADGPQKSRPVNPSQVIPQQRQQQPQQSPPTRALPQPAAPQRTPPPQSVKPTVPALPVPPLPAPEEPEPQTGTQGTATPDGPAARSAGRSWCGRQHDGSIALTVRMILDLFKLDGRVAVVTGGRRGLGQAMAAALAQAGADVACVSKTGQANATRHLVERAGRRFLDLQVDLAHATAERQRGLVGARHDPGPRGHSRQQRRELDSARARSLSRGRLA